MALNEFETQEGLINNLSLIPRVTTDAEFLFRKP
jgi:hypothetical protein